MPVDVGSIVRVAYTRGAAHTGETIVLTVTKPDGTTATPQVTESPASSGIYVASVDTTVLPGRYQLRWVKAGDDAYSDILDVWPTDPRFIISLDDAMDALRWRDADKVTNGESLRLYVAAATEVIEDITGSVLIRTVTQPANGGRTGIPLWERPSQITSVTVDGTAWPNYVADLNAGIIYAGKYGEVFPDGRQIIQVVYKTGDATIPNSIRLGARELVRHLWQVGQQSQGPAPSPTPGAAMAYTPSGFAVPQRVIELCSNHRPLGGIA